MNHEIEIAEVDVIVAMSGSDVGSSSADAQMVVSAISRLITAHNALSKVDELAEKLFVAWNAHPEADIGIENCFAVAEKFVTFRNSRREKKGDEA
jgi:hypothetical protein